jgi:hypothetical protein
MKGALLRWAALGLAAVLAHGCVLEGGGIAVGAAAPYGFDYYEPPGVFYGGWGPDYYVAPFRDHDHDRHFERGPAFREGRAGPRAFRAAPAGRAIPSIPTGPRFGGGARGGGGAHGGGAAHGGGPHR